MGGAPEGEVVSHVVVRHEEGHDEHLLDGEVARPSGHRHDPLAVGGRFGFFSQDLFERRPQVSIDRGKVLVQEETGIHALSGFA